MGLRNNNILFHLFPQLFSTSSSCILSFDLLSSLYSLAQYSPLSSLAFPLCQSIDNLTPNHLYPLLFEYPSNLFLSLHSSLPPILLHSTLASFVRPFYFYFLQLSPLLVAPILYLSSTSLQTVLLYALTLHP